VLALLRRVCDCLWACRCDLEYAVAAAVVPRAAASQVLAFTRLQDGTAKMSKSAENDLSRINLTDSPEIIANKVHLCGR
jgi:tryptophanyl-tRNA synthetase